MIGLPISVRSQTDPVHPFYMGFEVPAVFEYLGPVATVRMRTRDWSLPVAQPWATASHIRPHIRRSGVFVRADLVGHGLIP